MIVVTGATGHLGHHVVQQLIKRVPAKQVAVAVRDPNKAKDLAALGVEIRQADYANASSWPHALKGADKVLLISSNALGQRVAHHQAVIDGAVKAGVKLLVYTSVLNADKSTLILAKEHVATEKAILSSKLPYVFLRNGWYNENHSENLAAALEHGAIAGSAGDGRFSSAARSDYAAAAVEALVGQGHANHVYELAGDKAFTLKELAAEVAKQSGKPVVYKDMPQQAYAGMLAGFGLPKEVAEMLADSDAQAAKNALYSTAGDLHRLIGRETTPISKSVSIAIS